MPILSKRSYDSAREKGDGFISRRKPLFRFSEQYRDTEQHWEALDGVSQGVQKSVSAQRSTGPLVTSDLGNIPFVRIRQKLLPVTNQLKQRLNLDQNVVFPDGMCPCAAPWPDIGVGATMSFANCQSQAVFRFRYGNEGTWFGIRQ